MGKFYLTNNSEWSGKIRACLSDAGFELSGEECEGGAYLSTYKKFSIDNENFYKKGDDYAACTGTLIYKGKIGSSALMEILSDYSVSNNNINIIRRNCIGSYCLIIKIANLIDVCVDELQSYYLHYYIADGFYFITPQAYHIARIIPTGLDKISVAQKIACRTIPDNRTPFNYIRRLLGNEMIRINYNDSGRIEICNIGVNKYTDRKSVSFDKMINALKNYGHNKASVFDTTGIFCTGGLDSRCILSMNLSLREQYKHNVELFNWRSDDESIPASGIDTKICHDLSKRFNLPLKVVDCTDTRIYENIKTVARPQFDVYGEMMGFHAGNFQYHCMLKDASLPKFIEYGSSGEIANQRQGGAYSNSYKDILDYYMSFTNSIVYKHIGRDRFKRLWKESWDKRIDLLGISPDELDMDDCTDIYNFFEVNNNLDHINVTNLFRYSTSVFTQKEVFDYLSSLPFDEKDLGHISLSIVNKLYPTLLEVPIFSHRKNQTIDFTTLRFVAKSTKKSIKDKLKDNKVFGGVIKPIAERFHEVYPHDKNGQDRQYRRKLIKLCEEWGENEIKMNSFSEITYLAEYAIWLKINEYIEK